MTNNQGFVLADFISGLNLSWSAPGTNASNISVGPGSAFVPGLVPSPVVEVGSTISPAAGALAASTQYYLYLTSISGVATVELSTTAPAAPYRGDAQTKTGDTTRRLIGRAITDASGVISTPTSIELPRGYFSAYRSTAMSKTSSAYTKIAFDAEEYDVDNWFTIAAGASQGRYQPGLQGHYVLLCGVEEVSTFVNINIYKNGVLEKQLSEIIYSTNNTIYVSGTAVIYLNGSSDYAEAWVNGGATATSSGRTKVFFQGWYLGL